RARQDVHVGDVAGRQLEVGVQLGAADHQGVGHADLGEVGAQRRGLGFGQGRGVQDHQRAGLGLGRERMLQGQRADLLGQIERMAADDRTAGLGAADDLGRPARAVTGAAGALLLVHLLARTRDLVADLDLVRAGAALCELPGDHALQDVAADLFDAEDVVREVDRAALGAVELDDVEFHYSAPPVSAAGASSAGVSAGAAAAWPGFLKAPGFGASAGAATFTASRIFTNVPSVPGTAPFTRIRPRSASTRQTVRLRVVTVSVP